MQVRNLIIAFVAICGVLAIDFGRAPARAESAPPSSQPGLSLLGAAFNGMREFNETGTWTAPGQEGESHVLALLCGAGGGGSGPRTDTEDTGGARGASGGSVLTTIPVVAGTTYTVTVGKGGARGVFIKDPGGDGGATTFSDPSGQILAAAEGGEGGTINELSMRIFGLGGGGQPHPDGGIVRRGGGRGSAPVFPGGSPSVFPDLLCLTFSEDDRGLGGAGGVYYRPGGPPPFNIGVVAGGPGLDGWALLIW